MSVRRVAAGVCAVAGVLMLAGFGWALLTAAALLFFGAPSPRLAAVVGQINRRAVRAWRWVLTGRQQIAAASMPLAILAFAVGLALAVGVGWGIAAAGMAVGGLALRADGAE